MSDEIGSNNNLVEYVMLNVGLILKTRRFSANDTLADLGDFADSFHSYLLNLHNLREVKICKIQFYWR